MFDFVFVLFGYLLGSIPSAFIVGKMLKRVDIRHLGDGNVGAANAFREIGPAAGLGVMVADVLKGSIAIIAAQAYASPLIVYLTGIAAVGGHIWPVFLGFHGGRGESTAAGVLVVMLPQPMLILFGIALIPFFFTRNTMVLGAFMFAPLWLWALLIGSSAALVSYTIGLPCMVGLSHAVTTRHLSADARQKTAYIRRP